MIADCSFVRTADGLRFAYLEQGEREGPAVLMLHGFTDSHRSFDLLRPHCPESWRVIAMTQRGHGKSDKPQGDYAIAEMAEDVYRFLDALGVERAVIVGHSMGAAVALFAAAQRPERVAGLVLLGAFASFGDNPAMAELAAEVQTLSDPVDPEFIQAFQESTFAEPIPQRFLETVIGESMRCPAHVWRGALKAQLDAQILEVARKVRAPAALICGANDAFVPKADQLKLRQALPSARLHAMTGVGHAPHWERPGATAAQIAAFMGELMDAGAFCRARA